jgi:hypothetical protein
MSFGSDKPSLGMGNPVPHARQERQASSVSQPLEGQQRRKSPVRRCFKSRSSAEAEFAGSPPAAGSFPTVNRPLVRIPADRHTTTGTCDLGKVVDTRFSRVDKYFFHHSAVLASNSKPARHFAHTGGRKEDSSPARARRSSGFFSNLINVCEARRYEGGALRGGEKLVS